MTGQNKCMPVACLLLALASASCRVDQTKEVDIYRRVVDFPQTTQPSFDPREPLTLLAALELTNQTNERLSIEGENYLQALIARRRAVANFLPTVDLAAAYLRRDPSGGNTGAGEDGGSSQSNRSTFDVSAIGEINLFNGFQDVARLRVADLTIDQRRMLLLDAQQSLLGDVVQAFFRVLRDESLIRVLESSIKVQEERVRDIRGKRDAGVARPLDVAQTEAQASATRVTLIDARNALNLDRASLAFLTSVPLQETPLVDRYVLPTSIPETRLLMELAQLRREDLLAAKSGTLAARQNVEVAFAQYYPSVSLNLEAFLYRETVPDDRQWEALLSANVPIFSAGRIEADVRTAWSQFRQAVLIEGLLTRQIQRDVEQTYDTFNSSALRIAELETQVAAANQAFQQASASYNAGLATNLERVTAQDQLLSAQLQLASEVFNRKIAYLNLLRATGSLKREIERFRSTATAPGTQPATFPTTQETADEIQPRP